MRETLRFNRGTLRKLAQKGLLEMVESYDFDDQHGESRSRKTTPVRYVEKDPATGRYPFEQGIVSLRPDHFTSKSGCAWLNENGTITLYVHSNSNLTFRRRDIPTRTFQTELTDDFVVIQRDDCLASTGGAAFALREEIEKKFRGKLEPGRYFYQGILLIIEEPYVEDVTTTPSMTREVRL